MKTLFKLTVILIIIGSSISSCKKNFDEINTDPHGFTTASDGSLFNGLVKAMMPTWDEQFHITNEIL